MSHAKEGLPLVFELISFHRLLTDKVWHATSKYVKINHSVIENQVFFCCLLFVLLELHLINNKVPKSKSCTDGFHGFTTASEALLYNEGERRCCVGCM